MFDVIVNVVILVCLFYFMVIFCFVYYLKVMVCDKIGSFMEVEDVEFWLNCWILFYVNVIEGGG